MSMLTLYVTRYWGMQGAHVATLVRWKNDYHREFTLLS